MSLCIRFPANFRGASGQQNRWSEALGGDPQGNAKKGVGSTAAANLLSVFFLPPDVPPSAT